MIYILIFQLSSNPYMRGVAQLLVTFFISVVWNPIMPKRTNLTLAEAYFSVQFYL